MKHKSLFTFSALMIVVSLLAACAQNNVAEEPVVNEPIVEENVVEEPVVEEPVVEEIPAWVAPDGSLGSYKVETAPVLDGELDALWADATEIVVEVTDGANMGETDVTIKSVYTDDMVYFYVTYEDPTQSFFRSPWEKQEDGSWVTFKDPNDKGGDNNVFYEDKMSFIWNIDNSIPDFNTKGCYTACHEGQDEEYKPYGNKSTDEEGQLGDIWHWKSVRNIGQLDDQYLDSTQFSLDTKSAGRHGDPKDGGGYVNNKNEDGTAPLWMAPADAPKDGSPGYILASEALDFDDSLFVAGDIIPGITKAPFEGDRGNISAGWMYVDGAWVIEIGRAFETGSMYDVQWSDLTAEYYFGVAVFDNAQVRHATQEGVNVLIFQP
jgi:hypothetical protein